MPAIRRIVATATADALNGLNFAIQNRPALISLWAVGVTESETVSFLVNSLSFLELATYNVESSTGVIDSTRDQLLFREGVPAGQYRMNLPVITTNMNFLLNIEPV